MLVMHPNVFVYLAGVAISAIAATYAFRLRGAPGARWLIWMLVATGVWSLAEAFDYSSVTIARHVVFGQLSYLGATTAPVLFLLFALEYCGVPRRVSAVTAGALFVIPAFVTGAAFTNAEHHLVWPGFSLNAMDPTLIAYSHGPLYWLVTIYSLLLGLLATVLIIGLASRVRGVYRMQAMATILAAVFPWFAELAYSIAPARFPGFDPAFTLGITGAVLCLTMVRYRLLDLVPIAREVLVEEMCEGIVVLDELDRLLEINPAALTLLGVTARVLPGAPVIDLFAEWPAEDQAQLQDVRVGAAAEIVTPAGVRIGVDRATLGASTPERRRDLFLLRDVTLRAQTQAALERANADLQRRVAEVEELQTDLLEQATRDPLTGLHNRRYFAETLERELGRAAREGYPVSLVMLDVDHFKITNDTCGHPAGDSVLRVIGAELRMNSRLGDVTCRLGGDEFAVVLPNTVTGSAYRRAERWRETLEVAMADLVEAQCLPTVSLGVATYPQDGRSLDEIVAAADAAVYAAKARGRNQVALAARALHGPRAR